MNLKTAYELTLSKVDEIEKTGIRISIHPHPGKPVLHPQTPQQADNLNPEQCFKICFHANNETEFERIIEAENMLKETGIYFDTGSGTEGREWQLDWSFTLKPQIS